MELHVHHKTDYLYTEPNRHSIQYIRLTPHDTAAQTIQRWHVDAPASLTPWQDGFGNIVHTLVLDREHEALTLTVNGHVITRDVNSVTPYRGTPQAALFLLQETRLTAPGDGMEALVKSLGPIDDGGHLDYLHRLMLAVREEVDYVPGETDVHTTAARAFNEGRGVCQDHAHIFAACARLAGIPTRYVSGYLCASIDGQPHDASHAWAESLVPGLGWVGFDPANSISPDENYVRVAVGRDYRDAAPVRGIRTGSGEELLAVRVAVLEGAIFDMQQ